MSNAISCSEKTKNKMGKALKRIIINEGFEKITVSDITDECGIHRQTFYYHFQDKYELLDWLLYTELLEPFIDGFCFENMYDRLYDLFSKIYDEQNFYQNAFRVERGNLNKYVSRLAKDEFSSIVAKIGIENGVVCTEEQCNIAAEFIGFGVSGIIFDWVRKGCNQTPEQLRDKVACIIEACKELVIKRSK